MTSRDTHDITEYERERTRMEIADEAHRAYERTGEPTKILKSTNVQPGMVARLMAQSEPCLFSNKSPVAVVPYQLPPMLVVAYALMYDAVRWHAQLQVSFDRSIREELVAEGVKA